MPVSPLKETDELISLNWTFNFAFFRCPVSLLASILNVSVSPASTVSLSGVIATPAVFGVMSTVGLPPSVVSAMFVPVIVPVAVTLFPPVSAVSGTATFTVCVASAPSPLSAAQVTETFVPSCLTVPLLEAVTVAPSGTESVIVRTTPVTVGAVPVPSLTAEAVLVNVTVSPVSIFSLSAVSVPLTAGCLTVMFALLVTVPSFVPPVTVSVFPATSFVPSTVAVNVTVTVFGLALESGVACSSLIVTPDGAVSA